MSIQSLLTQTGPGAPPAAGPLSEHMRDALIATNLELISLYEQLEDRDVRRLAGPEFERQRQILAERVEPLRPWPKIPERTFALIAQQHGRLRHLLDYVRPGDRILDIGPSHGYATGLLLRDSPLSYYCGVDVAEHLLEAVRQMIEINDLERVPIHLVHRSVFDLDADFMREHRPDLVVIAEVLEHIPEPEKALATVAGNMPESCEILFSVPMLGRIEHVWGHHSVFDHARILSMVDGAGLTLQRIEPLFGTWIAALAGRDRAPSPRLGQVQTGLENLNATEPTPWRFVNVRLAPNSRDLSGQEATVSLQARERGVAAVPASGGEEEVTLSVHANGRHATRLEFVVSEPAAVSSLQVETVAKDGSTCAAWRTRPRHAGQLPDRPTTVVLRPGRQGGRWLVPYGPVKDADTARVRITARFKEGHSAELAVTRMAYLTA